MARLLIQFVDDSLADFRWSEFDETKDMAALQWQSADASDLSTVASQIPEPIIFIIPQQLVYVTQIELPEKASRQIISSIEFQIEDQLAQDIESQHFALGNSAENPIAIAVVSRSIMDRCLALAQGQGLRLIQIVPEMFLCPWHGEGIVLIQVQDGYLLRYGDYRGLKCNTQTLAAVLALIERDFGSEKILFYGRDSDASPSLEGIDLERHNLDEVRLGLATAPLINLQQRDYQLSSAWRGLAKTWRWIALLVVTLLAVGAYNKAIALQQLERELSDIKQQQFELLKPYFPDLTSADENLKKRLITRLQQLRNDKGEQGFLSLLLDFTRARQKFPAVEISRIGFQANRLSFEISSSQLNDIEALLEAVLEQGVQARLENLSIKPEQSAASLILQGDDRV